MSRIRLHGPVAADIPVAPNFPADVCILSFPHSDINAEENKTVTKAFQGIKCPVSNISLDSWSFSHRLKVFLNGEGARIIHIYAHGRKSPAGLVLSSRKGKRKPWSEVQAIVQDAKCDVLVILDCCYAGLAELNSSNHFAKALILAATWNDGTYDNLAKSLGKALNAWNKKSTTKEASSLHTYLENALKKERNKQLDKNDKEIADLEKKKARMEKHPDRNPVVQKKKKEKIEFKLEQARMAQWDIEAKFPQPVYKKGLSITRNWRANRKRESMNH